MSECPNEQRCRWLIFFMLLTANLAATPSSPTGGFEQTVLCADSVRVLFSYTGLDTSSNIGKFVSGVGDINGDGLADMAVSSALPRGTYLFYGNATGDTVPHQLLLGASAPAVAADFDGDGFRDILTSDLSGGVPYTGLLRFYRGYADSIASSASDSLSRGSGAAFGLVLDAENMSGGPAADLLTCKQYGPDGDTVFFYRDVFASDTLPDWSWAVGSYSWGITGLAFIDFNGDHAEDIAVSLFGRYDTSGYVYLFYGPTFGSSPSLIIAPPAGYDSLGYSLGKRVFGWGMVYGLYHLGDFDADGYEDLGVSYNWGILGYRGGPAADSLVDWLFPPYGAYASAVGDVNGDGYQDIATGDTRPPFGGVNVFLGGPRADTTYDFCFSDDPLPINYLDNVGRCLAPLGDFDGDGVDDILLSAGNFAGGHRGDALVVAGSRDIVTDVDDPPPDASPSFIASCYPNPFNGSIQIAFSLPASQHVTVSITNVLGQTTKTIANESLEVGQHALIWQGDDEEGNHVSSGIYFVRIATPRQSQIIKVLLLK